MDVQELFAYCLALPGTLVKYPFGPIPAVLAVECDGKVKGFCDLYENAQPLHIVVKCDPVEAQFLRELFPCVKPGYHCNKIHWNSLYIDGTLDDWEIKRMLRNSYLLAQGRKKETVPFGSK